MVRVSASPHVQTSMDIQKSMIYVACALLPASLWGVYAFGFRALLVLIVSIASSVLVEYLLGKIDGSEKSIFDCSALVTGLLVGMNMPPQVPILIPVIASAFAIAVVKWTFGGLGCNWMNPALGGRVFVFFSFTSAMSTFSAPRALAADASSMATPLSGVKTLISSGASGTYQEILASSGTASTGFANSVSAMTGISPYTVDAFFGNVAGCIGEVSALLLILGGVFLIVKKVITWHIPVVYIGSFAILSWIFGGTRCGMGLFHGEILMPLFSGGLMLGAFFMATDWVTSPTTVQGQIVYAFGCGFFTFLIRYFGSLPEGVSLAILLMNIVTPTIERYIMPKKFGYVKPVKEKKK